MSHFLIVGADDAHTCLLREALPGRVLHVNSLAGQRASHLLANASAVVLNFRHAFLAVAVASALRRAQPQVRVFAVSGDWHAEDVEQVLDAGAEACFTIPLDADTVEHVISRPGSLHRGQRTAFGEIQYRHGYPGRHLGSVDQPGF